MNTSFEVTLKCHTEFEVIQIHFLNVDCTEQFTLENLSVILQPVTPASKVYNRSVPDAALHADLLRKRKKFSNKA